MALRLSPEDHAEYERRCAINQKWKEDCIAVGDNKNAKRARQANSALYQEFERKQLPQPLTQAQREDGLSLEDRIDRIEYVLKLGKYA